MRLPFVILVAATTALGGLVPMRSMVESVGLVNPIEAAIAIAESRLGWPDVSARIHPRFCQEVEVINAPNHVDDCSTIGDGGNICFSKRPGQINGQVIVCARGQDAATDRRGRIASRLVKHARWAQRDTDPRFKIVCRCKSCVLYNDMRLRSLPNAKVSQFSKHVEDVRSKLRLADSAHLLNSFNCGISLSFGLLCTTAREQSSRDSGERSKEDQPQANGSQPPLPSRILDRVLCHLDRSDLLAQVVIVFLGCIVWSCAIAGGWLIPQRPKLGVATGAVGFALLCWAIWISTLPVRC